MQESVVLVHGIWMTGATLLPLRRRLRDEGFRVRLFSYPSLASTAAESAERLHAFLAHVPGDVVHFVGHSMGGIVLLHLFDRFPPRRPGRVVFLGTPAKGSTVARSLGSRPLTRWTLGRSGERSLLGGAPAWGAGRDLGLVAGTVPYGIGRLLGRIPLPHDGTVALAETEVPGAADRLTLRTTHTALLWSPSVAQAVVTFLRTGRFGASGA
jgi:pimeloyl-ACP methyl ester carboxylesterase